MADLDKRLLLAVLSLLGIGLVQVYSSSYIFASENFDDGLLFLRRQAIFAGVGLIVLFTVAKMPLKWIAFSVLPLWIFTLGLIAMTLVPGIGIQAGGATRWLPLFGGFRFEPSEMMKIALPLTLAWLSVRGEDFPWKARIFVYTALFAPLLLLLRQPDFGSFSMACIVIFTVMFINGLKMRWVVLSTSVISIAFYFLIMNVPYRKARVLGFLDPWSDPANKGFQIIQSLMSFHSGGLTGVGLGQSQGKLFFLPEAHTDFTLAVLGEETGFLGFLLVMALYGYIIWRGFRIAIASESRFAQTLCLGLTVIFAFSTFLNVGVVLGLLPTKGLTLPFLSYGGSSLVATCFLFGLLLNCQRHSHQKMLKEKFLPFSS